MTREDDHLCDLGFPSRQAFEFPNFVNVEVFRGACPCNCVHCPVGMAEPVTRRSTFGEKGIDLRLYDRITAEVGAHPWATVRVHSVGDPVLWRDLPEALRIGKLNNARSWIFTCAVTRDRALLEAMCENASVIEVSVNSTTPEDYRKTKGINAFDLVMDNITHLRARKGQGARVRLLVSRVQSSDRPADKQFVDWWRSTGLVDDAFVRSYHTYNDALPQLSACQDGPAHEPCLVHWARFNVSVDGLAIVCFNELFKREVPPSLILGDLRRQSIADIWHGPKLAALRRSELRADYTELPFGEELPCRHCTFCQPLFGDRQTSEHQIDELAEERGKAEFYQE